MTIQDKNTRIQYTATAAQTEFVFPFEIFENDDLQVYLTPVGQPSDPAADLLPQSAYVITLNAALPSDGKITLNTPATLSDTITLEAVIPLARQTDFATAGEFRADEVNLQLDKITRLIQQNNTLFRDRGLFYAVTDKLSAETDNLIPQLKPNQAWFKNGAGKIVGVDINGGDVNTLKAELESQTMAAPGSEIVGHYDPIAPGGTTVKDMLELNQTNIATNVTNIATNVTNIGTNATNIATNDGKILVLESTAAIIPGVQYGCTLVNNAALPLRDLDIEGGVCMDTTLTDKIGTAGISKKLDLAWAVGTGMGGLLTGAIAANTTYHVYMIRRDSDGLADIGFDPALTPTLPAGYTKYNRIGSIVTDGASNIIPFIQNGNHFLWKTPFYQRTLLTLTGGVENVGAILPLLPVSGEFKAILDITFDQLHATGAPPTNCSLMITSLLQDNLAATAAIGSIFTNNAVERQAIHREIILNQNNDFRVDLAILGGGSFPGVPPTNAPILDVNTLGWIDKRGGDTF